VGEPGPDADGPPPVAFAAWLRGELTARGWEQTGFAELIGVAPSSVANWVAGRNRPNPDALRKIAEALGVGDREVPGR
jgi:transcriptional regulator with XRE-family HTH domain